MIRATSSAPGRACSSRRVRGRVRLKGIKARRPVGFAMLIFSESTWRTSQVNQAWLSCGMSVHLGVACRVGKVDFSCRSLRSGIGASLRLIPLNFLDRLIVRLDAEHLILGPDKSVSRACQIKQTSESRGVEKSAAMTDESKSFCEEEINAGRVCRLSAESARIIRQDSVDPDH